MSSQDSSTNEHQRSGSFNTDQNRSTRGASAATSRVKLRATPHDSVAPLEGEFSLSTVEFGDPDLVDGFTLPPQDTGFGAWSYVAAAFAMYIVVWGYPNAFPIFQAYLSREEPFSNSVVLPLLAPGIQDILEGIFFQVLPGLARYRRLLVILGISIMILAVFMASYATTAVQIVLTQGLLFGCGADLLNFVHVSVFVEWFSEEKQAEAMGIIWSGYRVGGLAFPLICQWLLDAHGFHATLRVLIAPMLALLLPSIILLRGRYPVAQVRTEPTTSSSAASRVRALTSPTVLFLLLISLLLDLVIDVPVMFISRFGAEINLDTSDRAVALTLCMLCRLIGTYVFGWLSNGKNYEAIVVLLALWSSFSHFLLWGYSASKFMLFAFAISIGLASGGQDNSLYPFYASIAGNDVDLYRAIHSLFSFVGGFAILSVGPVGVSLLKLSPVVDLNQYAIGKYKYLVFYSGGMSMAAGLLLSCRLLKSRWLRSSRSSETCQAQSS